MTYQLIEFFYVLNGSSLKMMGTVVNKKLKLIVYLASQCLTTQKLCAHGLKRTEFAHTKK